MPRSEAYDQHPHHTLVFDEAPVRVRIRIGETVVAETDQGLNLREGKYPATVYIPRQDVRMKNLEKSDQSTHCPFKGDASYFDFLSEEPTKGVAQVAWSYEDPFDQMLALKGHLAFYSDRVAIEFDSE